MGPWCAPIKNMGFSQLRLVHPRPFDRSELARVAHHAEDVIAAIGVYATLDEALADAVYVVGTSAIVPSGRILRRDIEPLSRELLQKAQGGPVALLFGTEDDGLDTVALDRCHSIAALPASPTYPALNLAQIGAAVSIRIVTAGRRNRRSSARHAPSPG